MIYKNPLQLFDNENVLHHRSDSNKELSPAARAKKISSLLQKLDRGGSKSFNHGQIPDIAAQPPFILIGAVNDRFTVIDSKQNVFGVNHHALGTYQEPLFSHFSIFSMETGEAVQHYQIPFCTPQTLIQGVGESFFMFDTEGSLYHLSDHEDHFSILYTCQPRTSITCAIHSRFDNEIYGGLHIDSGVGGDSIINWSPAEGVQTLMRFEKDLNCQPTLFEASDGNLCGVTSRGNQHPYGSFFQIDENKQIQELFFFPNTLPGQKQLIEGRDGEFYGVATDYAKKLSRVFRLTSQGTVKILSEIPGCNLKPLSADAVHFVLLSEKPGHQRQLLEINQSTLKTKTLGMEPSRGRLHRIIRDNKNDLYSLTLEPTFAPKEPIPISVLSLAPSRLNASRSRDIANYVHSGTMGEP